MRSADDGHWVKLGSNNLSCTRRCPTAIRERLCAVFFVSCFGKCMEVLVVVVAVSEPSHDSNDRRLAYQKSPSLRLTRKPQLPQDSSLQYESRALDQEQNCAERLLSQKNHGAGSGFNGKVSSFLIRRFRDVFIGSWRTASPR